MTPTEIDRHVAHSKARVAARRSTAAQKRADERERRRKVALAELAHERARTGQLRIAMDRAGFWRRETTT